LDSNVTDYPTNPHQILRFDWEQVLHTPVLSVLGCAHPETPDQWESIAFVLDDTAVILSIDFDTDQLSIVNQPLETAEGAKWVALDDLRSAVGLPLGWCWEVRNYRGYLDGFLLAFGDVVPSALQPNCMFLGEASQISILKFAEMRARVD
jgi:hypothetical protein